jgi:release factor glutamine methyltransferase
MSLDFTVDNHVLVPRQETELLVDAVLDRASNKRFSNKTINIMDIGTGSCSIAVSLSVHLKNAQIYASDISEDALVIARMNAQKHNVANRIHLLHGNLFGPFNGHINMGCVDFIVSNPPYIKESEWIGLEPEVREYEPYIALVAGEDGLTFYKQIVNEAHMWLKAKGFLVVEVGDTQAKRVKRLVEREGHFENIEVLKDLQEIERVVIARRM